VKKLLSNHLIVPDQNDDVWCGCVWAFVGPLGLACWYWFETWEFASSKKKKGKGVYVQTLWRLCQWELKKGGRGGRLE